ncbi:MAG TPA: cytochrome P450 [Actinocrinis sp.]|uniref:cytochrome P450 n=1 Tax=Actinocrinis sp. TaxID=1920516 RepID=UPI002D2C6B21|nr:cytochrome P450 [Actinocrinis sp.]HZU57678.1 cytochrome P450 [Actinocrinis sp.]
MISPRADRFPVGAAATVAELEQDPHPLLARLRAHEPVSWLPALGGWLVTRRDLAVAVMRDAETFTVDDPRFSTARVVGPSMLSLDGPVHTRHRTPFAERFRPRDVEARLAAFIEQEAARLVDALRPAGAGELRRGMAGPLAVAVVAESLGLLGTDPATVLGWYDAIVGAVNDISAGLEPRPGGAEAVARLSASVHATVRAGDPEALLVAAGAGLELPEVVSNAAVMMFGGIETTEAMIANAVLHLLAHPDQLALVRADPGLVADAVEESVRLEPAAAVVDRYATRDVELAGAPIGAGDLVTVSIAGANRDPRVFAEPDRFDLRRPNARLHLGFAQGPHFCLGAHAARLETRVAVSTLLRELPGLRLDPDRPPAAPRGLVFRKPESLYVRWDA